jgi:hypothetical protein
MLVGCGARLIGGPAREGSQNIRDKWKKIFRLKSEDMIQIGRIFSDLISL